MRYHKLMQTQQPPLYERLMRRRMVALGARSRFTSYDQGTLHWLDLKGRGNLPPLVMVHGFSAAGTTQFGPLAQQLRQDVSRLILPDLPGHGHSRAPENGLASESMFDGLCAALDRALDTPAVLCASSMGGAMAIRYALRRPERVLGLFLSSPGGAPPPDLARFVGKFRINSHKDALRFVDGLFSHRHRLRHAYAWGVRRQFGRAHLQQALSALSQNDFFAGDELESLSMPICMLWGGSERLLCPKQREFFRAHLPEHTQWIEPPHFGHVPFLDHRREAIKYLLAFTRGLTSR